MRFVLRARTALLHWYSVVFRRNKSRQLAEGGAPDSLDLRSAAETSSGAVTDPQSSGASQPPPGSGGSNPQADSADTPLATTCTRGAKGAESTSAACMGGAVTSTSKARAPLQDPPEDENDGTVAATNGLHGAFDDSRKAASVPARNSKAEEESALTQQPPNRQVHGDDNPPQPDPWSHPKGDGDLETRGLVDAGALGAEKNAEVPEAREGNASSITPDAVGARVDDLSVQPDPFSNHKLVVNPAESAGSGKSAGRAKRTGEDGAAFTYERGTGPGGAVHKLPGQPRQENNRRKHITRAGRTFNGEEVSGTRAGGDRAPLEDRWDPTTPTLPVTTHEQKRRHRSLKYRTPAGAPPTRKLPSQASNNASPGKGQPAQIDVRVLVDHGSQCSVSLLPIRPPGLPDELIVSSGVDEIEFEAMDDRWFQDVTPENLGYLLRNGFVWTDRESGQEWLLSGREVYVLAESTTHRGYVSRPRLLLGQKHVILCTVSVLPAVEEVLREAGCASWTSFGEADGAPSGWAVLQGIVPQHPLRPSSEDDILNVLRPLPEIEIKLEGGIRLVNNRWLLGYPPVIRTYGDPEHIGSVLIDGQEAAKSNDGSYIAPGWDEEGEHQVWCGSASRGYSLVRPKINWRYWPAYSFSLPSNKARTEDVAICGPLVRSAATLRETGSDSINRWAILVPPSNPVLLGSQPGQVFVGDVRTDVRGAQCLAFPPFDPVWAVPAQPLLCDKRTNRILLVGDPVPTSHGMSNEHVMGVLRAQELWYRLILNSSRKGLAVEPANDETCQLWAEYKRHARHLWRRMR